MLTNLIYQLEQTDNTDYSAGLARVALGLPLGFDREEYLDLIAERLSRTAFHKYVPALQALAKDKSLPNFDTEATINPLFI